MSTARPGEPRLAVVIPCRNEATTIAKVVAEFRGALPAAEILVIDNGSTDASAAQAAAAGAQVIDEPRGGKGFALAAGFSAARDADYVIMVDGDDTYPADRAGDLVERARQGFDMVVGTRLAQGTSDAFPLGHLVGNRGFNALVRLFFGLRTADLFSGYRVLSRRLLAVAPLIARGFEADAELSLQAAQLGFKVSELPVTYRGRPPQSASKLRTLRDGWRILISILTFLRDYRPVKFFGLISLAFIGLSLAGGSVVILEFLRTGLVPRLPLAVLSAALFMLGALSFTCGVILSSINRRTAEIAALLSRR